MANTSDNFPSIAVPFYYAHRGNLAADHTPKTGSEIELARLVRRVCSTPEFYEAVRDERRSDGRDHARLAGEHMGFALLCGTALGSPLFMRRADEGHALIGMQIGEAADALQLYVPGSTVTPFVVANGFIGLALRAAIASGSMESDLPHADDALQLTALGARRFFVTRELLTSFRAIDVLSWLEQKDGLFIRSPQLALVQGADAVVDVLSGAVTIEDVRSAGIAAGDKAGNGSAQSLDAPVAIMRALQESAYIAELLDAFEVSGLAPSTKPQLTRPAVRIILHELGLTEHGNIGELRAALTLIDPSDLQRAVRRRSDLYGMTARAGRTFNNTATPPGQCVDLARAAKKAGTGGWKALTRDQRADREIRWAAWFAFLSKVQFENGPLPMVAW